MNLKKLLVIGLCAVAMAAQAGTNIQIFYDFGSLNTACYNQRTNRMTTTVELFYPDKWGSTFAFIDLDYNIHPSDPKNTPFLGYFEIARCLNFWQQTPVKDLSVQVEYNGGLGLGFGINSAFLVGADWFLHSSDFKNTLNLKLLYKKFVKMPCNVPLQFTAVWGCQDLFGLEKLRFSGFVDFWCEYDYLVVLSEPQLWYGIGDHFNIGGEVELSYNFGGLPGVTGKKFNVMPCIGTKWVF